MGGMPTAGTETVCAENRHEYYYNTGLRRPDRGQAGFLSGRRIEIEMLQGGFSLTRPSRCVPGMALMLEVQVLCGP